MSAELYISCTAIFLLRSFRLAKLFFFNKYVYHSYILIIEKQIQLFNTNATFSCNISSKFLRRPFSSRYLNNGVTNSKQILKDFTFYWIISSSNIIFSQDNKKANRIFSCGNPIILVFPLRIKLII